MKSISLFNIFNTKLKTPAKQSKKFDYLPKIFKNAVFFKKKELLTTKFGLGVI